MKRKYKKELSLLQDTLDSVRMNIEAGANLAVVGPLAEELELLASEFRKALYEREPFVYRRKINHG